MDGNGEKKSLIHYNVRERNDDCRCKQYENSVCIDQAPLREQVIVKLVSTQIKIFREP